MLYQGEFINRAGDRITVEIVSRGDRSQTVEIGADDSGIWFDADPVTVTCEVNDTFDHIVQHSATIRVQTETFLSDLFAASCLDVPVMIFRNRDCIFSGFVEPMTYSQPFNEVSDTLELNCIDALGALQYFKYGGSDFDTALERADEKTFLKIIESGASLVSAGKFRVLYDGSLTLRDFEGDIFSGISISEMVMITDDDETRWTYQETIGEIMRYLNLCILQTGTDFYIFSRNKVKEGEGMKFDAITYSPGYNQVLSFSLPPAVCDFTTANAAGCNTNISISEVFNRISVVCDLNPVESLLESPLNKDSLISPFSRRQLFLRTYTRKLRTKNPDVSSEDCRVMHNYIGMTERGEEQVLTNASAYADTACTDWFMQWKTHPRWQLQGMANILGGTQPGLASMSYQYGWPMLVSLGCTKTEGVKDNAPQSKIEMTDYLVMPVKGNGQSGDLALPKPAKSPTVAKYVGKSSGAVISPADDETTNYIVISGKIALSPIRVTTGFAAEWRFPYDSADFTGRYKVMNKSVPVEGNSNGRYLIPGWYDAPTPFAEPTPALDSGSFIPFDPESKGGFEYQGAKAMRNWWVSDYGAGYQWNYGERIDEWDRISKLDIFSCMLVIGDKVLVETGKDGGISDFRWLEYKKREDCADDDEYYAQTFNIGINPKIGDFIIGREHDIANNIGANLGIDAEGMAIPVKKSDAVSGKVEFTILGPIYQMWETLTYKHQTWFRASSVSSKSVPLLANVDCVFIKDFEVKVYSDNALNEIKDDAELVYSSNTDDRFVNPHDEITFRFASALTASERSALSVPETVCLNTPKNVGTHLGVLQVRDHVSGVVAKPEQLYVNSYYSEYRNPRVLMTHEVQEDKIPEGVSYFSLYTHPALPGKTFFAQGITRNLMSGTAELNLKEISHD